MTHGYPLSDHYDGRHFFNPPAGNPPVGNPPVGNPRVGPNQPSRGLAQVLRWRLQKANRTQWPAWVTDPAFPPPPASVAAGQAAVTFINHATFLLRLPGAVVLTDPIFSPRCSPVQWAGPKRARAPGIALADLPRPDVVVLSHNHYDHMDLPSLREIQRRFSPRFVTTLGNAAPLSRQGIRADELDWWQDLTLGGLHMTLTPARHFSARTPFDRNETLWGGCMLRSPAGQVLFAGDSGFGPHWQAIRARLGAPSLALLPIGAYEPRWFMSPVHMNPEEAVQAHLELGAHWSVGMHFGTFQLTDEAIDAPLIALAEARRTAGLPAERFGTLGFGETRVFDLSAP